MAQTKVKIDLPTAPVPLPDDTQDHFYASDEMPDLTPEEIARDWEILRQYEAENGPIVPAPLTKPIDPSPNNHCSRDTHAASSKQERRVPLMKARDTLEATRAFGQMRKAFFNKHLLLRLRGGSDYEFGTASDIFEGEALQRLAGQLSETALQTPVVLTDYLSNRVLAVCLTNSSHTAQIAVNVRYKIDAEVLLHTMAEEFTYAHQVLDGVDFAVQKRQYAYAERPYEIEAKRIAALTLGYEPEDYEATLWRPEPFGVLYDLSS